ncbi:MAG: hypothetical protein VX929_02550 [Pseudomonadota bacterium]|nr:hypothetical protein [Pseudomonadota bacterium]
MLRAVFEQSVGAPTAMQCEAILGGEDLLASRPDRHRQYAGNRVVAAGAFGDDADRGRNIGVTDRSRRTRAN